MPDISPDVIAAAQAAQRTYGILASVSIAQWALESGWGAKTTGAFNYFGIKAGPDQPGRLCPTHEVIGGQRIEVNCKFRDFASETEAFAYHAALLATGKPYADAWKVRGDYVAYVQAMAPRYATDPNYAHLLISIIQGDSLTRYDLPPAPAAPSPIDQLKSAIGAA